MTRAAAKHLRIALNELTAAEKKAGGNRDAIRMAREGVLLLFGTVAIEHLEMLRQDEMKRLALIFEPYLTEEYRQR